MTAYANGLLTGYLSTTFQDGGMGVPVNGNLTFTFLRNWKRLASASSESSSIPSGRGDGGLGLDSGGAFLGFSAFGSGFFSWTVCCLAVAFWSDIAVASTLEGWDTGAVKG